MDLLEQLLDLQVPTSPRLSPDGRQLVYCTTLSGGHSKIDRPISTIWIAATDRSHSARKLTQGHFHDHSPRWHPDGASIAFLSDRSKPGEGDAIYILDLNGGEPYAVSPASGSSAAPVEQFEYSPDGKCIVYRSGDAPSETPASAPGFSSDAQVWSEEGSHSRLRYLDLTTGENTVLVSGEFHVDNFAWNEAGDKLLYSSTHSSHLESPFGYGTSLWIFDVASRNTTQLTTIRSFLYSLALGHDRAYFVAHGSEGKFNSAHALYTVSLEAGTQGHQRYGFKRSCVDEVRRIGSKIVVKVLDGMKDQLVIVGEPSKANEKPFCSLNRDFIGWDVAWLDGAMRSMISLCIGDVNTPTEVNTYQADERGISITPERVSSHGAPIPGRKFGKYHELTCPASDSPADVHLGKWEIDAVFLEPHTGTAPYPTVVLAHGGPYSRHNEGFDGYYFMWAPLLLAHGYAVLIPNYRGSSGKGDDFAAYARVENNLDSNDYNDGITLTNHAVEKHLADPSRLLIGGYSHGGYITNLAVVKNGTHGHSWRFQAAMSAASVSDGDTLQITSDFPMMITEFMGPARWSRVIDDTASRPHTALPYFYEAVQQGVEIPPLLILHGADDTRVPVEQAHGMRRAYQAANLPCECVIYKGEGHVLWKRRNVLDAGLRLLRFVQTHLGSVKDGEVI